MIRMSSLSIVFICAAGVPFAVLMIARILSGILKPFIGDKPAFRVIKTIEKVSTTLLVVGFFSVFVIAFCRASF